MQEMSLRDIRNKLQLFLAILFCWLYIPHLLIYVFSRQKKVIDIDVQQTGTKGLALKGLTAFLFLIHNERYFRNIFYYRIGPILSSVISWIRPGDRYFIISKTTKIGPGIRISHPYSTILNADRIGSNFSCRHLTTIGYKTDMDVSRPVIGNNVTLGAGVTIVGAVHIGNNVTIGAGSVVVKDIPDNAIAVGNPAKVIKYIDKIETVEKHLDNEGLEDDLDTNTKS